MIKRLRIKFVCVIMSIMLLMHGVILCMMIHHTMLNNKMQSIAMMRSIAGGGFPQGELEKPDGDAHIPYFTVQIGRKGELLGARSGNYDLSDQESILRITDEALAAQEESGYLRQYHLRFLKERSPGSQTIFFWDTTMEEASMEQLVGECVWMFLIGGVIFLGISILLSHWVIKPVATAWDQQRQFVADASHELKTPLSVIMANAELMMNEETDETDRKKFSKNILSMTYQMRSLVENMLEMARVDNGTLKMKFESLDFSQLVSDAVLSFQLLYEEQGLGLRCAVHEGIMLHGSEQHLYQVLDVLLDNALKYSAPGGMVSVDLTQNGRGCTLSVASPGDPISKEDLKNIFKRFYRADKARAMNGSYGLGLAIAESVVEAHKGKIWAESEHGYNTFHVHLPVI